MCTDAPTASYPFLCIPINQQKLIAPNTSDRAFLCLYLHETKSMSAKHEEAISFLVNSL